MLKEQWGILLWFPAKLIGLIQPNLNPFNGFVSSQKCFDDETKTKHGFKLSQL